MDVSVAPRPAVPSSTAPRPAVATSSAPRPRMSVSVAPAGSVPPQPQKATRVDVSGWLGVDVSVKQVPNVLLPVSASLVPDVSVTMIPSGGTYVMSAAAEMSFTVSPVVVPVTSTASDVLLDAAVIAKPALSPAASLAFDVTVAMYKLANQGIDKSGNQELASTNTWTRLTPWVARTGYPATTIEDDGIRVPAGLTATYEYRMSVGSAAGSTQSQSIRLLNGAVVVDSATITNTSTSTTRTGTFVGTGEIARLEASVTASGGRGTITSASYLVINVL